MSESDALPLSVAPTPEIAIGGSVVEDLNALFLSGSNIIKRVANTTRIVHPAAEELQILKDVESRINTFHANSLSTLRFRLNQLTQINALPDEILLMIFLYTRNDKIPREMLRYIHLSWVCRRWRFLAVNSPVLWKLLDYSCQKDHLLEEIIRRSKGAKVQVGLLGRKYSSHGPTGIMGWSQNYFDSYEDSDKEFGNFQRLIIPILFRVEYLHLTVRGTHLLDALQPLQKDLCPSIRRCLLRMRDAKSESTLVELLFSKIFNSQKLEVLEIHSDYLSLSQIAAEPQVPNLRYLALISDTSTPDLPALQDILRIMQACCSSLEILEIITSRPRSSTPFSHPKIDMTRLRNIRLLNPADVQIMEYLSTPALRRLALDCRDLSLISPLAYFETLTFMKLGNSRVEGYQENIDGSYELGLNIDLSRIRDNSEGMVGLAPHFEKWANHLSSLELKERPIGAVWLRFILTHAHSLRHLCLEFDCEEILSLLEDPATCPQLESFTYTCREGKPGKRLLYLMRLRHNLGTPLSRLTLSAKQPVARTHEEKLRELVDFTFYSVK